MRRNDNGKLILLMGMIMLWSFSAWSQTNQRLSNIHFYQLNTSHGLSDNYITTLCTDKSGNLWIGTGDGLNVFNGKTVTRFFPQEYPQMRSSDIKHIICDDKNRIWILTGGGYVTIIDEHRKFHSVGFWENEKMIPVRWMLPIKSKGIVLFTTNKYYVLEENNEWSTVDSLTIDHFNTFAIKGFEEFQKNNFRQVEMFSDNKVLFTRGDSLYEVDFISQTLKAILPFGKAMILTQWSDDEILTYNSDESGLSAFNLSTGAHTYPFENKIDQYGKPIKAIFTNAYEFQKELFLLTTQRSGIYIYDKSSGKFYNHKHNAADPTSIANNNPKAIAADSTGWVFLGATPNGVSYFKSNAVIGQQSIFMDAHGNSYDGYINNLVSRDDIHYYIGVHDNLLYWNRNTNTTEFLIKPNSKYPLDLGEVNYVAFDNQNRLWAAVTRRGIAVYNQDNNLHRFINLSPTGEPDVPENYVRHINAGPDGYMWLSTRTGILKVNMNTLEVSRPGQRLFKELENIACNRTWFQQKNILWIGSDKKGAWKYNFTNDSLTIYDTDHGLSNNTVYVFNEDKEGNLFIGTSNGLDIFLKNGKQRRISRAEGLFNGRIEALLLDNKNRMWIGNDVAIACYSVSDSTLKVFDERYGLSVQGFRVNAYYQNTDGELIWGTERGLQYFYPDDLYGQEIKLKTTIHRIESGELVTDLTTSESIELSPGKDFITFYFSTIDYSTHLRTFYQYKLEGLDEDWNTVTDQNSVRYNSLEPGTYVFHVRASNDKKTWVEAENQITITKSSFFWDRPWFSLISLGIIAAGIFYIINRSNKKQKQRTEELETEVVINYFASRINTHQTTDELLWDVAKNCISRLKFEDCVIYMLDEERNVLVQKAAYGPKSTGDHSIHQPIEVPIGHGIVGTVAKTGKPELISDTTRDPRYIVDDIARQSELTVPIILNDRIIGVIDSENSKKNFFTERHLAILKTIAVLCTNQLQRNEAEIEKQQAKIEVAENKQKAAESRLQSLRLQMNPHFLFNALNSIQQMILANEEMVATRYLSRFSKLLRHILIHSDKETISLKEEIEILRLYVELESVRFKDAFSYEIICDEDIDADEVKIPTLLIQPFVENAIWHGLMHKEGKRELKIEFTDMNDHVQCVIEDNGIGRQRAAEIKITSGRDKSHTSKGIKVSVERLNAMHKNGGPRGSMVISDLVDPSGEATGTRVQINLPIQN